MKHIDLDEMNIEELLFYCKSENGYYLKSALLLELDQPNLANEDNQILFELLELKLKNDRTKIKDFLLEVALDIKLEL